MEEDPGALDKLMRLFDNGRAPRPRMGPEFNRGLNEDSIRDVRYLYALGVAMHQAGRLQDSVRVLEQAKALIVGAQDDPAYSARRGGFASIDLIYCSARILRELAVVRLQLGNRAAALSNASFAISLELTTRAETRLPEAYVKYLQFVFLTPEFTNAELEEFVARNVPIPTRYMPAFSEIVQIRAAIMTADGDEDEAFEIIDTAGDYLVDRLYLIPNVGSVESEFVDPVRASLYRLFLLRRTIHVGSADETALDQVNLLDVNLILVWAVRNENLENEAGPEYTRVLRQTAGQLLTMSEDPEITSETVKRIRRDTQNFIRVFDIDDQEEEDGETPLRLVAFRTVAAEIYQALANASRHYGDLRSFLLNGFRARYIAMAACHDGLVAGNSEPFDLALVRLRERVKQNKSTVGVEIARLVKVELDSLLAVVSRPPSLTASSGGVRPERNPMSLTKLAQAGVVANFQKQLRTLEQLLNSPIMHSTLAVVAEDLDMLNAPQSSDED